MKQMALVIDLNKCVGCQACAVNCKAWNNAGEFGPLPDSDPYGENPDGVWFNRVQTYEVGSYPDTEITYLPKSCMHCEDAPCVQVCPTAASYKREEDGIVLVNYDACIGCKYCSWACPYGCREYDFTAGLMKKCTLCVDRIYDMNLPEEERKPACVLSCPTQARSFGDIKDPDSKVSKKIKDNHGYKLMPKSGAEASNHYLPKKTNHIEIDIKDIKVRRKIDLRKTKKSDSEGPMAEDVASP